MSTFSEKSQSNGLDLVKGTVLWCLNPGEIARRINTNEFANLSDAKGVYVQEGVVAVLMIDGRIVTTLTSGVYYFQTGIERFGEAIRHIVRFFTGRRKDGSGNSNNIDSGRLGSELQNLGKQSLVDVILVIEGAIPVVFGFKATSNESKEETHFEPFTIKTKYEDLKVAISMHMGISDFAAFRKNNITNRAYYRIADLQIALKDPIQNLLQEYLENENIEAAVLPPALKDKIRNALTEKINKVLYGLHVIQIIDISINSTDFERFRELEHKLYCSHKELDYLIRTNEFKNRLAQEENSQTVREAQSEEDLRYALQKLNKDSLLHDDEMEEFCQLLANQKAIREAKTDEDRDKALQEIKKSKLIREDEFEDLQYELKSNHDSRVELDMIRHWQSYRRTETERINADKDIRILTAESAIQIEQKENELKRNTLEHEIDLERISANFTLEMNNLARLNHKKDWEADIEEDRAWTDNADYEDRLRIERERIERKNALEALAFLRDQDRKDNAQKYSHDETMAKLEHETRQALIDAQKGMSGTQIAALNIGKLTAEAQVALASALSSVNEKELLQKTAEEREGLLKQMIEYTQNIEKENREQQENILNKLMSFMTDALKTNSSVVNGAVAGQKATADNISNAYTQIISGVEKGRQEAKDDARYAQARMDHAQDTAIHYTTKLASAETIAGSVKGNGATESAQTLYTLMKSNAVMTLADVIAMINCDEINPDTELSINGFVFRAYDRPELKNILDKRYSVECPNCHAFGLRGHLCPECKKQL